ncbi:23S rRNA (guanosine(2251)-2'-O)-methyltransferase RlmB [Treponema sp.]|uniref:23S rRNA (guanosine(2251)-2'-O)-methyltransferase RlmB n=1 Tax=Treponema sp. TaxID=166 RepID=UPI003F0B2AB0
MSKAIYTGFHAVEEKIRLYSDSKPKEISLQVYYSKPGPRVKKILSLAKEAGFETFSVDEKKLDSMTAQLPESARSHRGIVLLVEGETESSDCHVQLEQWISECPGRAVVIVLDSITDPHNVGAIIRSCDQFGASLMVIPDHRSADIGSNETIARTSAGAVSWVKVAKVPNLVRAVQILKASGFWIYGADAGGESISKIRFPEKTCIIMGSEGSGIARLLGEQCDSIVSIPTCGKIDSLNVSVAAGVLLYEVHRQSIESL